MGSQFEETLRKHRTESEAIMKIVAPKYVTPEGSSYGRPYEYSSGGGSRGGGGGGSSGPSAAEVERKRQAELKRQQAEAKRLAEAKKIADQLQAEKKDKAQSQTIGGQVTGDFGRDTAKKKIMQTSEVQAYSPEQRYTDPAYKQGWIRSAGQSASLLFADVKSGNVGSPSKYIEPFKYTEKVKKDVVAYTDPVFGTVQTDPVTGKTVTGDVTYGDMQRKVEQERDKDLFETSNVFETKAKTITSGYQGKVDAGELTVKQATKESQKEYDALNVEYAGEQEKIYKKSKDVPGVFERTGKTRNILEFGADTAVVATSVGVGVVNPVLGASIGLGYFAGKGILEGTQKPTYKEIGEQGGILAGVGKDESGKFSILEPTALDVKYKTLRKKAGMDLLVAATYGIGTVGAIDKSIITGQLKELGNKPVVVNSVSFADKKGSFDVIRGSQKSGGLRRDIVISGRVVKEGKNKFIMPSGKGYSTTTGKFDWHLGGGYGDTYYAGGDIFNVGSEGSSFVVEEGFGTLGKSVMQPHASFGSTLSGYGPKTGDILSKTVKGGGKSDVKIFAGVSKKFNVDDAGIKYYKTVSGDVDVLGVKGKSFTAFSLEAPKDVGSFGIHRVIKVPGGSSGGASSGAESFFSFGRGGTSTKVFKSLGLPSSQGGVVAPISESISKGQIKSIIRSGTTNSIITGSSVKVFPSIVEMGGTAESKYFNGGSGLIYDNQVTNKNIINGFKSNSMLELTPQKDKGILSGVISDVGARSRSRSKNLFSVSSISAQRSVVGSSQIIGQKTGQKLKSRTIQNLVTKQSLISQPISPASLFGRGSGFGGGIGFPFIIPKMAQFKSSKGKTQKKKQKTRYQTSLTGSILGIKGTGFLPGALSIRGIIDPKNPKHISKKQEQKKRRRKLWWD